MSAVSSPVKHLKVVVFPAPVTPSKAKHSPYSKPKVSLSTAGFPSKLYCRERSSTLIYSFFSEVLEILLASIAGSESSILLISAASFSF